MRRRRLQRGFTLIELMTVIAMVAILSAILVGVSSGGGPGKPRTTADRITGMAQFARLRAIAQRKYHRLQIENNVISVWEAENPGFASPTFNLTNGIVQSMDVPVGVLVWNIDPVTKSSPGASPVGPTVVLFTIDFKPDGQSTGGTVYLTDNTTHVDNYRVFVYKTTGAALSREGW